MYVNPLLTPAAYAAANTSGAATATNAQPPQNTDSMFMQLLTAQLQNQSPLDPVDPTQFTAQLVQFNMLDQLAQINQTLRNAFSTSGSGSTAAPANYSLQGAH